MPTYHIGFTGIGLAVYISPGTPDKEIDALIGAALDDIGGTITDWWGEDIEDGESLSDPSRYHKLDDEEEHV